MLLDAAYVSMKPFLCECIARFHLQKRLQFFFRKHRVAIDLYIPCYIFSAFFYAHSQLYPFPPGPLLKNKFIFRTLQISELTQEGMGQIERRGVAA